jgi:hypothetical protein
VNSDVPTNNPVRKNKLAAIQDGLGRTDDGLQLGHGAGVPGDDPVVLDDVLDRGHRRGGDRAQLDLQWGGFRLQQPPEGGHRGPRPVQLRLQPLQVVGDQGRTHTRVGRAQDALDLGERYVELPQSVDDLGRRDLVRVVVAIAGQLVHLGRLQQSAFVVAAQRAHAQVRHPGELADRQHARSVHPLPERKRSAIS